MTPRIKRVDVITSCFDFTNYSKVGELAISIIPNIRVSLR